ncbi:hypothetical protein [Kitasatospora sp. NPDC056531]|uniref:hypothetical protein n=1 Tax=Kitasatospora sp. NPDC056531 TaxID=3345856 RepID=UPI0036B27145
MASPNQALEDPRNPASSSTTGKVLSLYAGSSYCGGVQTSTSPSTPEVLAMGRVIRRVRRLDLADVLTASAGRGGGPGTLDDRGFALALKLPLKGQGGADS